MSSAASAKKVITSELTRSSCSESWTMSVISRTS